MKRHHTLAKQSHFGSRECKCITHRGNKINVSEEYFETAIFKTTNGESENENGGWGMGNGESLKWGESLKAGSSGNY